MKNTMNTNAMDDILYSLDHLSQEPSLLPLSQGSQSSVISGSTYPDNNPILKAFEGDFGIQPPSQPWRMVDDDEFGLVAQNICIDSAAATSSEELAKESFEDKLAFQSSATMSPISNPPSSPSVACTSKPGHKMETKNECEAILDSIFNNVDLESFELTKEDAQELEDLIFLKNGEVAIDHCSTIGFSDEENLIPPLPPIEWHVDLAAEVSGQLPDEQSESRPSTSKKRKHDDDDPDFVPSEKKNSKKAVQRSSKPVNSEDQERKGNKKIQNRDAAKRYREKNKKHEAEVEAKRIELEKEHDERLNDVESLIVERNALFNIFVELAKIKPAKVQIIFPAWFRPLE